VSTSVRNMDGWQDEEEVCADSLGWDGAEGEDLVDEGWGAVMRDGCGGLKLEAEVRLGRWRHFA